MVLVAEGAELGGGHGEEGEGSAPREHVEELFVGEAALWSHGEVRGVAVGREGGHHVVGVAGGVAHFVAWIVFLGLVVWRREPRVRVVGIAVVLSMLKREILRVCM